MKNIEVVGTSLKSLREKFTSATKAKKKKHVQSNVPQTWGGDANRAFKGLIREGFFEQPNERAMGEVVKALELRGLPTEGKEHKIAGFLARRARKGILKESRSPNGSV